MKKIISIMVSALLVCCNLFAFDFQVDGIGYTVTSFEKFTVAVDGLDSSLSGVISIPSTITYSNKNFLVTSINSARGGDLESLILPESITSIGLSAFSGTKIKEIDIPNSVTEIGRNAFANCAELEKITISNNVNRLNNYLFENCINLKEVNWHPTTTYGTITGGVFYGCSSLRTIRIPAGISLSGGHYYNNDRLTVFKDCTSLDSLIVEDGADTPFYLTNTEYGRDYYGEFKNCKIKYVYLGRPFKNDARYERQMPFLTGVEHLVIGDNVTYNYTWLPYGFCHSQGKGLKRLEIGKSLTSVNIDFSINETLEYIKIDKVTPPTAVGFSNYNYINTILYVPKGCKPVYESSEIWKNFWNILEYDDGGSTDVETKKCAKPIIKYSYGKLSFHCDTELAAYHSTITDLDIASYNTNEVQLDVTYNISVYATKTGYENSDVATATLCWVDVEPQTEGLSDDIAQVRAKVILIQSMDGQIAISGIDDDTRIYAYEVNGQQIGTAISHNGQANLTTNLKPGSIVIIKIGDRSVKATIK